jgi:hypothetical protein
MSIRIFVHGMLLAAATMLAQSPPVPHVTVPPIPQVTQHPPLPDSPALSSPEDEAVPVTPERMPIEASYQQSASEELRNALQRRMGEGRGKDIEVQITKDGSVTLGGTVPSAEDRKRAEQIARFLADGYVVRNQIGIKSNPQVTPRE